MCHVEPEVLPQWYGTAPGFLFQQFLLDQKPSSRRELVRLGLLKIQLGVGIWVAQRGELVG